MDRKYDIEESVLRLGRAMRRGAHTGRGQSGAIRVISILFREDGIRAADLAERLDIRPSSLTEVLKKMEEDDLIIRKRDEHDSRVTRIYATDTARHEFSRHRDRRDAWHDKIHECLTEEEIKTFCEISDKLADFMEREAPERGDHTRGRGHNPECGHGHGHGPHGSPHGRRDFRHGGHHGEGRDRHR